MCGATGALTGALNAPCGLSPRVWGNQTIATETKGVGRFIPTCVGQPVGATRRLDDFTVYPHVCGATYTGYAVQNDVPGLSPRVWGNPLDRVGETIRMRSIPTCVGQPLIMSSIKSVLTVYPHVCGATISVLTMIRDGNGLSPRVWGNLRYLFP